LTKQSFFLQASEWLYLQKAPSPAGLAFP